MNIMQLKIKIWVKPKKKMYDDITSYRIDFDVGFIQFDRIVKERRISSILYFFEDVEILHCTGIKDIKNNLIYEGDILKCANETGDTHKAEVVYYGFNDYPAYDLKPNCDTDSNNISYYKICGGLEVIGNIKENPELLELK